MSIYTKTGDEGMTSLANMQRVSKCDARLETYGTADELNSWLGLLRAAVPGEGEAWQAVDTQLLWLQNKLFNLGASLSEAPGEWIAEADVVQLEQWIDGMQTGLKPVHAFVLPAGSELIARCHVCRTVTRRLERLMVQIAHPRMHERRFVNRLSDYLFVLSRHVGQLQGKEVEIWQKQV